MKKTISRKKRKPKNNAQKKLIFALQTPGNHKRFSLSIPLSMHAGFPAVSTIKKSHSNVAKKRVLFQVSLEG